MVKKLRLRKLISFIMLFIIVITNLKLDVYADEQTQSEQRTSSMVGFFRENRTGIDTGAVSKDEIITYGIFISNFFMPGVTTLGDIGDIAQSSANGNEEDTENQASSTPTSMATKISEGLFGSSGNKGEVQKINDKIFETLINGFSNGNFDLTYKAGSETGKLTGKKLLELMGYDGTVEINKSDGKTVFKLNSDSVNAALKVCYGVNPSFFLEAGGLRDCGKLFIDGFGNIWAEPVITTGDNIDRTSSSKTYKIVLPACLNPAVFGDGTKFPVVNSFVMGNILNISGDMFQSESSSLNLLEPYYNIAKYLKADDDCLNSMLNIFGIEGVDLIGDSDGILKGNKTLSEDKYTNFLSSDGKGKRGASGLMIALNPDNTKTNSSLETIRKSLSDVTSDAKLRVNILKYLNNSIVLPIDSIDDVMTYFNFNWSGSYSGTSNDWSNINSPIVRNSLFSQSDNNSDLLYYNNSYAFSSYSDIYHGRKAKDIVDSNELLKGVFYGSPEYKGNNLPVNHGSISKAILKVVPNAKIGEILVAPKYSSLVKSNATWFDWFGSRQRFTVGYSLTEADNSVLVADTRLNSFLAVFSDNLESSAFSFSSGGGSISKALTYSDMAHFRAYFNNFYNYKVFGLPHEVRNALSGNVAGDTAGNYKLASNIANGVNNWPGVYWGYMTDLLNISYTVNDDGTLNWEVNSFSNDRLPDMPIKTTGGKLDLNASLGEGSSGLSANENKTEEEMYKDILKKVYGILSPEENEYRNNWIKATLDSWLISLHRSITGSWVGNVLSVSSGVTNSYSPVVGYINTPTLMDLPLTNWIMSNYMNIYVLLLLVILMMLISMTIIGLRTIRNSVLIFMLMSVVLLLPNSLLNNSINFSNSVTDSMFSDRFNYWAITQHQQNVTGMSEAKEQGNLIQIIQENMSKAENVYAQDTGVKLKWMSPKKVESFNVFFKQSLQNSSMSTNLTVFNWLFSNFFNQEEYVYGNNFATYLYRPYNDIANTASESYTKNATTSANDLKTLGVTLRSKENSSLSADGYAFKLIGRDLNDDELNVQYSDEQKQLVEGVRLKKLGGGNDSYKAWFGNSSKVTDKIFEDKFELDDSAGLSDSVLLSSNAQEFLYLTESPFYYFYNALRDNYASGSSGSMSFKQALLNEEVFSVKGGLSPKVYNKRRDFLDMEGLFTNVIPYLNQSNQYVINWIDIYGDDVPKYDFKDGSGVSEEFKEAEKKKEALQRVWNLYSPWVDTIYDADVYNKRVTFAKKKVRVADTLNPGAYDEVGRPMVWSEADMYAKNIRTHELTETERKIQDVLDKTYIDLMYLLNYYDFDDEVLLTMSAMMATFNFNEVFSDNSIFKHSNMLYPQGFELKNFNYDAFMKMTLMNATGEPLMHKKDLYSRVISKTSFVTGLLLVAEDVIAVIVIPTIKLTTMLLLVFLGLLLCVSCVVSPPDKILKTVTKTLLIPVILFTCFNIAFAYVVSTFVGEGMTYYTGSKLPTLATNDPTITILLLILAGCVYVFCMFKVLKVVFDTFKTVVSGLVMTSLGVIAGAGMAILGGAKNKVASTYRNHMDNASSKHRGGLMGEGISKALGKATKNGTNIAKSGNGTGANSKSKDEMLDSNTSPIKDKNLKKDINKLTKGNKAKTEVTEKVDNTEYNGAIRTVGRKAVDIKYSLKDKKDKIADTVTATKDYVTDSMVGDIKNMPNTVANKAKGAYNKTVNKAVNSVNDVRDYERQLQLERNIKLKAKIESKEAPSNLDMHRYGRENARLSKVLDKGRLKTTHSNVNKLKEQKSA